jgi:hypothetical protein
MGHVFSLGCIFYPAFRDFLDPSWKEYQESLVYRDITRRKTMFYIINKESFLNPMFFIKTILMVDEVIV